MKKIFICVLILVAAFVQQSKAQGIKQVKDNRSDTVKVSGKGVELVEKRLQGMLIDPVVVIANSLRDSRDLGYQAVSYNHFTSKELQSHRVFSVKSLTGSVPNLYIPDYGSKLTSSIYIRGIGSRINSSAVGVYVDDFPYYDKSAFDFDFSDVNRVDVLRGPQGTLYGMNSMGGIIDIHTKSPFEYAGTDLFLSAATKNNYRFSLTHYHRISKKFAFSAGGFADHEGGFYKNRYNGKNIDKGTNGGGRFHAMFRPNSRSEYDLNVSYEYTDMGGYPYGAYNKNTGSYSQPNYNFGSGYYRNLLNVGLKGEYTVGNVQIASVTGWQHLRDRMSLDQDFTAADRFTMLQKQKQNTVSEEIVFKNINPDLLGGNVEWQRSSGVSAFYQWQKTNAPLDFGKDFISLIQQQMNAAMSHSPVAVKLTDSLLQIPGKFSTPTFGAAIYHQSVFKDLFGAEGLSATVGIRLDYEKVKIDYDSRAAMNYNMLMHGAVIKSGSYAARYFGNLDNQYFPILPKFSIDYRFNGVNNVYVQVSRGYRSGGYNIQMLSDYLQSAMMSNKGDIQNDSSVNLAIKYKPEYSWNYEVGAHLTIPGTDINIDAAAFYMRVKNQQVARFVESGLGRYTTNAGKSRSCGVEFSARGQVINNLSFAVNYGYTHATFREYFSNEKVYDKTGKAVLQVVDYKGRHVPFAPENTFSAGLQYSFPLERGGGYYDSDNPRREIRVEVEYTGSGRTFFTEANDVSQKFYGLLNARVVVQLGRNLEIDVWGRNLLNKDYAVFYFDSTSASVVSGSTGFMQKGKAVQAGIDLRIRF